MITWDDFKETWLTPAAFLIFVLFLFSFGGCVKNSWNLSGVQAELKVFQEDRKKKEQEKLVSDQVIAQFNAKVAALKSREDALDLRERKAAEALEDFEKRFRVEKAKWLERWKELQAKLAEADQKAEDCQFQLVETLVELKKAKTELKKFEKSGSKKPAL